MHSAMGVCELLVLMDDYMASATPAERQGIKYCGIPLIAVVVVPPGGKTAAAQGLAALRGGQKNFLKAF